ncbi:cell division protein FtsZ [Candidatus Mycoplasma mahonii]|uniref:cell division protein FtsZ n=1 Tax=Candidatus Mycoplasma mahonii TaxID=3004105 RepID=UPI0026EF19DE|nr:cell division protein FtsZ [Candidatus Mycoplasma mahonii]WKX02742.1 cell division protein FtsZ [Candidatus Mycoplasma mahonii]
MFENNNEKNNTSNNEVRQKVDAVARIKVIGVGGGGNNTIHSMIREGIEGVEFIVANTDEQVLNSTIANTILPLGRSVKGLGAGANPEEGRKAALESENEIKETIKGADMVIIAAGMGGGTGTGAAPIIAKIAKDMGALTIGIVTTPFSFEGTQRSKNAAEGLENIRAACDSLIVVSNDKLLEQFGGISLKDSFIYADKILKQTVRTITDLIAIPALINLDFADVTTVMKDKGTALIGIGRATGDDRASKAAIHAISSPILDASINGASHAIINISGGDITLAEASKAVDTIKQAANSDLNIIFGVSIVESLGKDIQVSVIATGLVENKELTSEEILKEASNAVETMNIDFENDKTRELLMSDPLPEEEKLQIDDEIELQNSPWDSDDDDDDELPAFLRK